MNHPSVSTRTVNVRCATVTLTNQAQRDGVQYAVGATKRAMAK